jgi:2-keto-4-pentenoate hydratase/2-oxohepta-3-ene-1,7-dioic acid hydratase in catechol pathway
VNHFQLGTFSAAGGPPFAGVVVGEKVYTAQNLTAGALQGAQSVLGLLEHWENNLPVLQGLVAHLPSEGGESGVPLTSLQVHAPILPRQIFQAGANYHKHVVDLIVDGAMARDPSTNKEQVRANAAEMMRKRAGSGKPFIFMGLWSSVIGPHDPIILPYDVAQPDWELELAAVIGRPARRVSCERALDYVAGYTIANDITSRELVQRPDVPQMGMDWIASKGTPTFLPVGPFITPSVYVENPQSLQITLRLNGQTMQDESTADMIFSVARLIEFISRHAQLLPGDLVLTGSPSGNGTHYNRYLRAGDVLEGEISGLGRLQNPCVAERQPT